MVLLTSFPSLIKQDGKGIRPDELTWSVKQDQPIIREFIQVTEDIGLGNYFNQCNIMN